MRCSPCSNVSPWRAGHQSYTGWGGLCKERCHVYCIKFHVIALSDQWFNGRVLQLDLLRASHHNRIILHAEPCPWRPQRVIRLHALARSSSSKKRGGHNFLYWLFIQCSRALHTLSSFASPFYLQPFVCYHVVHNWYWDNTNRQF